MAVTTSGKHACALLGDGTVRCWGDDSSGQVVDGTLGGCLSGPSVAVGFTNVAVVAAGPSHTCAVLGDRSVRCWGGNRTSVSILADAVALATNEYGTCVVDTGGSVDCWGAYPQLGTGTTTGSSAPTPMQGLGGVASLAIGTWDYCAVRQDGSLRCWAYDAYSSLGTMSTAGDVPGITSALGVAVGDSSACVRLAGGEVRCWGQNSSGQLGSGTSVFTNLPVTVTGF